MYVYIVVCVCMYVLCLWGEPSEVAVLHEAPALHAQVVLHKVRKSALLEPVANTLACMHVCMYICMYICLYICMHVYLICMYVCMSIYVHVYVCMVYTACECIYVLSICICVSTYVSI